MFNSSQFNGDVHFLCFQPEISCLGKFVLKIKTQFNLKFGTWTISNVEFNGGAHLFCFRLEVPIFNGDVHFFCFQSEIPC